MPAICWSVRPSARNFAINSSLSWFHFADASLALLAWRRIRMS
ncbi:hypothetical protein [Micromonospora robiginosa]|uniref:Uncharacterized protein n=1 Tax=Micromonospora robiginosa TaxID=2749844 RepID=A0AAF0SWZ5_9ACTN|nr:hypothetical protein [Micromonospora ferruginea]WMF04628.1 hypothetical protein H1D33_30415 [Micromonospora ferruginea]